MMMQEETLNGAGGAIVFDAALSAQVTHDWFAPAYWRERDALRVQAGGRGGVAVIDTPAGECVLRHYRRGGLVATLMGDRYLWRGAMRTRPFAEFHLLAEIERLGLALFKLNQRMDELKSIFGLTDEDLNIDLGPLGRLR